MVTRVMVISWGITGSTLRAKPSCTGPLTWPQFSAPLTMVVMTAPNVLISKKFSHIQFRITASTSTCSFSFLALIAFFKSSGFMLAASEI